MADLSNVVILRTAQECIEAKYAKLDDAGIVNLIEMAKEGRMKDEIRIAVALQIAHERELVEIS